MSDEALRGADEMLAKVRENLASPYAKQYPDATQRFGSKNVESALIMVDKMVDPRRGLKIVLPVDDEALLKILEGAFETARREELNSGDWEEKLGDAIETVRYSFKLPIILLQTGGIRVVELNGDVAFEGTEWAFVRWVRDAETLMISVDETEDANVTLRDQGGHRMCGHQ